MTRDRFSIPFIAGQWSLPAVWLAEAFDAEAFSIPFIAGQWSLQNGSCIRSRDDKRFSIPFIAGQWSLPVRRVYVPADGAPFNPLHCGAVVASRAAEAEERAARPFNPLHCGAVVASFPPLTRGRGPPLLSIPFIAGQWSLQDLLVGVDIGAVAFQSPSLRGSGRFPLPPQAGGVSEKISIPFIAGQWSLQEGGLMFFNFARLISIPFIAGQWSLRCDRCTLVWNVD